MSLFKSVNFYWRLKNHLARFYFLSEEDTRIMQDAKLQTALQFAQRNISFYKKLFSKHHLDLDRFGGIKHIKNIPFTEPKSFFAQAKHDGTSEGSIFIKLRSSGTSGMPKNVYLSCFDWLYSRRLAYLRMIFLNGFYPFYKNLFLRSANMSYSLRPKWFWKLGLMREKAINVNESKSEQAAVFNQYQPDVLNCLTSDGIALADFMKRQSRYRHKAKYLFTTGEILTVKNRQEIVDVLAEKVIDFYANTEAGIIAWQCSKTDAYHINADQLYVEIIDGQRICQDGEEGEVVLTALTPCYLPLIRYRTADIAVLEHGRCKCGSRFPRLSQIKGRKNDFLIDSNGERISPYVLMSTMDQFKEVLKYSIHQNSLTDYTIYLELNELQNNTPLVKERIKKQYGKILGTKSNVILTDLCNLPLPDANIKRKIIVSDVK